MADKMIEALKNLEGEFKSAIERNDTAATTRLNDAISELESKMKAVEIAANRPANTAGEAIDPRDAEQKAAFVNYMRSGDKAALAEFKSVMSAGVGGEGGFTVPKVIASDLQKLLVNLSPMRSVANVASISTPDYHIPFAVGGTASAWVGEKDARNPTSASTIVDIVPPTGELFASPLVTQQIIEDSQYDVAGFVTSEVATEFARAEGAAFLNGDGVTKPKGLLTVTTALTADATRAFGTVQHVLSGAVGTITSDALIALTVALKAGHRANASFVMTKATMGVVRGLKDQYGQYLWQTSYQAGMPSTLLGFPVVEMEDMPEIANNALAIAFGDMKAAYTIVDRVGMSMLYDNISAYPYIAYKFRKRVGGTPVNTQAYKLLKIQAS